MRLRRETPRNARFRGERVLIHMCSIAFVRCRTEKGFCCGRVAAHAIVSDRCRRPAAQVLARGIHQVCRMAVTRAARDENVWRKWTAGVVLMARTSPSRVRFVSTALNGISGIIAGWPDARWNPSRWEHMRVGDPDQARQAERCEYPLPAVGRGSGRRDAGGEIVTSWRRARAVGAHRTVRRRALRCLKARS